MTRTPSNKKAKPDNTIILERPLNDILSEKYLAYALSTITGRALPDVRDGLKPVHRRLLFAMHQLQLNPTGLPKKSARVVGDVIGKFHPHGDTAVYDAMVRLAQDFAARYPMVDGQGNFGNIDGDNPAAMRYTEARLTAAALLMIEGIDNDTVDFRPTYDGEGEEPIVLPGAFPNLLANGAIGIAVGMATSIPPHNVDEICGALQHLIKKPKAPISELLEYMPGPDFPTGGIIAESKEAILNAYETGRGSFRVRARWHREELGQGAYQIIVTEIPWQVQKSRLIEKIDEMIDLKKLPLLDLIRDESTDEVRVVLQPKNRNVDAEMLMASLYRNSELEARISLNMNVLDRGTVPRVMNLREVLQAFLDHRHEVLVRHSQHRLDKIAHRLEVLAGYLIAYLNIDEVIRIIREEDEPKVEMIRRFKLTDTQAEAILNMRLRSLRKLEEFEIKGEHDKLTAEQTELQSLLADDKKRWKNIAGQIAELQKKFGRNTAIGKRRSELTDAPVIIDVPVDAHIEREPVTIIASEKGWIRAFKGHAVDLSAIQYKEGDREAFVLQAETTDKLLVFATNGRFYTIGADKLPRGRGYGEPLRLLIDYGADSDIVTMTIYNENAKLLVASDAGYGFIVPQKDVFAQTKNGKQILNIGTSDEASVCVPVQPDDSHIAVVGSNRKLLVFPLNELPEMSRGKGVILQKYKDGTLSDVTSFKLKDGLQWRAGTGFKTETNIKQWLGKRAQSGLNVPSGFPRSNRFD